jgi:hypothetical protein
MKKILLFLAFVLCLSPAAAQFDGQGRGFSGPGGVGFTSPPPVGGGAYSGPGDIVASATAWYGLRAYSAAKRGNVAINVCNVSDVACVDMSTDAVTGALVVTTVGGSSCSIITCTVKTFYDQANSGSCGGPCNLTNSTIANRPTLIVSCLSGKPCLQFVGSSSQELDGSFSNPPPTTVSAVVQRNAAFTTRGSWFFAGSASYFFESTVNTVAFYGGAEISATASDSAFHAYQVISNGASSNLVIDGTSNTGAGGAGGPSATTVMGHDPAFATGLLSGLVVELGIWGTVFSGGNISSVNSNQHTYWGF